MKKRIKLTSGNVLYISIFIGSVLCMLAIPPVIIYSDPKDWFTVLSNVLCVLLGACCIVIMSYKILSIFCTDKLEISDNTFLSKEDYTEVFYEASNWHTSEGEMILTILEKEEIKFFAKLTDDANILLVVRNRNDQEIYSCEISNFDYFEVHFQKEKN